MVVSLSKRPRFPLLEKPIYLSILKRRSGSPSGECLVELLRERERERETERERERERERE